MIHRQTKLWVSLLILPGFYIIGFLWFMAMVQSYAEVKNNQKTDAVVILTGGSNRIGESIRLLQKNYTTRVFISGVGMGATSQELLKLHGFDNSLAGVITVGHQALDTYGNAEEVKQWVQKNNIKTLRLVTSNYHMPRAFVLLRQGMPEVQMVIHAVIPKDVKTDKWWQYPGTRKLLFEEYNKYLFTAVQAAFMVSRSS